MDLLSLKYLDRILDGAFDDKGLWLKSTWFKSLLLDENNLCEEFVGWEDSLSAVTLWVKFSPFAAFSLSLEELVV